MSKTEIYTELIKEIDLLIMESVEKTRGDLWVDLYVLKSHLQQKIIKLHKNERKKRRQQPKQ